MNYNDLLKYRDNSIMEHNIVKAKLVSKVTTVTLLTIFTIELLFKLYLGNFGKLNWFPYSIIIFGNICWHVFYRMIEKSDATNKKVKHRLLTHFYIYFMLLSGAVVTIMNQGFFNNLLLYSLIVLICSAYFVLEKFHFFAAMNFSTCTLIIGLFFVNGGYTDQFLKQVAYLLVLNPLAYYVSRSFYFSFEMGALSKAKLMYEIEQKRKLTKELKDANRQLELQSSLDPLTKLYNRRAVNEYMESLSIRAKFEEYTLTSIMLDVDYFKQYNDTYGHLAGDDVLIRVGEVLQEISEEHGVFVSRWGGEEFMVILINNSENRVRSLCKTILDKVEQLAIEHKGSQVSNFLTVSIGAHSVNVQKEKDVLESLDFADSALYDVKSKGRNGFSIIANV